MILTFLTPHLASSGCKIGLSGQQLVAVMKMGHSKRGGLWSHLISWDWTKVSLHSTEGEELRPNCPTSTILPIQILAAKCAPSTILSIRRVLKVSKLGKAVDKSATSLDAVHADLLGDLIKLISTIKSTFKALGIVKLAEWKKMEWMLTKIHQNGPEPH